MNWLRFFRRKKANIELAEEMDLYMAEEIDENLARGMKPAEARRRAYVKLGNPQQVREKLWTYNTIALLENLWRDFRYAIRTLSRAPGFAIIAVLVMALGIGANVALFTVVRSVLLNPLPYRDSGQLYSFYEYESKHPEFSRFMPVDAGSFALWQQATSGAAEMAMVSSWQQYNVSSEGSGEGSKLPEKIDAAWCSWNFFSTLGVAPALGRNFTASDDQPDAEATVILTSRFWKRRYNSDPSMIGKKIWLDARPYTVIGVLPSSFTYATSMGSDTMQVWTPVNHEAPGDLMRIFNDHEFIAVARLAPGVTLTSLLSQLNAVQTQIKIQHNGPAIHDSVSGRTMLDDAVTGYKTSLYALLAATGCVLLIACLNVASLLVARTAARSKELAIRAALGGGHWRLLRERLMESFLLSAAGGAGGLLLAWCALEWLVRTRQDMNRIEAIHIDAVVALFVAGTILVCALFSGLISAASTDSKQILGSLQEASRGHSGGQSKATLRKGLLVLEVCLTVVLLVGAGLLLKSYQKLRTTDVGVPIENVLTMHFSLPDARYKEPVQQVAFLEQLIGRVRALPGVQAAGLVSAAPGQGWGGDRTMSVVEHPPLPKGQGLDLMVRGADPGYFAAIQLPLLKGRIFTGDERLQRAKVVVISQSAAKLCFPGEDPIGKHLSTGSDGDVYEVIGVVADTRWQISQPAHPMLYWPIYGNDYSAATVVIRSTHNVETLALPAQKILGQMDPDLPVSNVATLRETIGKSTLGSQFDSILVLGFAGIALLLAAAGLYGVVAYLVTQRTGEIGIRIALGAQREQVLRLMLLDGLRPAMLGVATGLIASAAVVRLIRSMLYETEPLDPAVFLAVTGVLLLVAGIACLLPAWRASRLDPMQALRAE
ncbi:MAG TPA: ABC transporter permease [Acidobacteriaceae bacterium]|jgi:putative ABC transport system permease protein|nr:ABC transporter permease [Acidobacteriaceae bacterium]